MTNDSSGPQGPDPDSPREFEWKPPDAPPPPPMTPPPAPSTPSGEPSGPATPDPEVAAPAPPPPPPPDGSAPLLGFAKRFGVPLLVIVIALGAFLWNSLGDDGNVAEEGNLTTSELEVGDCLKQPEAGKVNDVTAIPCAQKHESEVYATFDLKNAADAYPGEKKLFRVAGVGCAKRFESYMGIPASKSRLGRSELVPDETAWDDGDRGVTCLASMPGGKQTIGSLKGKGK